MTKRLGDSVEDICNYLDQDQDHFSEEAKEKFKKIKEMFIQVKEECQLISLTSSDQLFSKIIASAGDPIFIKDNQSRLLFVNDAFCSMFNLSRDEILGKTLAEEVTLAEREHFFRIDRQVLTSGEEIVCEESLTLTGGDARTILTKKSRHTDELGNHFIIGVIRDVTDQKKNEKKYESLFHSIDTSAIVAMTDMKGNIIFSNEKFSEISGYSKEELIGKNHRILNSGHHSPDFFKKMWATVAKGETWTGDIKNKAKSGSYYWVRTVITPIKDFPNNISSYLSIRFDITAEKKSEEENRFVLEALGLGIWRFNPVTQELHWDKSMYELFEISPEEFSGHYQAWESSLSKESKAKAVEDLDMALRGEKEFDTIFEIMTKSQRKLQISGKGKVIRDNLGNPILMYGINQDVTKTKLAELKLAANEALLSTIMETLPIAISGKDIKDNFKLTIWNKNAEEVFGIMAKDCIGKNDFDLFSKEQASQFREMDMEACRYDAILEIPEEYVTTVNGAVTLHTRKIVIKDEDDQPMLLLGVSENITEKLALQVKLNQERAKATHNSKLAALGEMSAGVAHEINNPLAIISGNIEHLFKFIENPEKFAKIVYNIKRSCDRIEKIVNGLRKFSRSGQKTTFLKHQIYTIVEEVILLTEAKSSRHKTKVTVECKSDSMILCDDVEIEQVLINLVNNAIDAVKNMPDRWIKILIYEDHSFVILRIIDSGYGIPISQQEKLFLPFFTTKKVGEGTGLGLSISKGILDEHNATISIINNSPNTCFEIKFPKIVD